MLDNQIKHSWYVANDRWHLLREPVSQVLQVFLVLAALLVSNILLLHFRCFLVRLLLPGPLVLQVLVPAVLAAQTAAILTVSLASDIARNPRALAVVAVEIVVMAATHDPVAAVGIDAVFAVVLDVAVVDFRLHTADVLVPRFH